MYKMPAKAKAQTMTATMESGGILALDGFIVCVGPEEHSPSTKEGERREFF